MITHNSQHCFILLKKKKSLSLKKAEAGARAQSRLFLLQLYYLPPVGFGEMSVPFHDLEEGSGHIPLCLIKQNPTWQPG